MSKSGDEFWLDRPVLVTGCTGLLGGWITRVLVDRGAEVVGLVRDYVPNCELFRSGLVDRIRVVRGDVRHRETVERILGEYEVDTVFHLAAQTIVNVASRNAISTFESNIRGTWCLLEACRRSPSVKQVVVASSDKAYGAHETLPYTEESPLQGRYPYDVSKSCADLIAQSYVATFSLPVCIARCANLYGGGDLNWNRLVPGTIRSVLRAERPVLRSDGKSVRDYLYVEDAALAYVAVANQMATRRDMVGQAFNFSNELRVPVIELVRDILRAMGREDLEPDVHGEAPHEIQNQYLDTRKAREVLGWQPLFTLGEGLARTIEWYRGFFADVDGGHGRRAL